MNPFWELEQERDEYSIFKNSLVFRLRSNASQSQRED